MLTAYLLLDLSHFFREKFNGSATFRAHHVVMAAAIVLVLVTSDPVVKGDFTGQPAAGEEFQGAVYRRDADVRIGLFDQPV